MKKLLLTLIYITVLIFAQQAQAQETKEYVTVLASSTVFYYTVAYSDGTVEKGKFPNDNAEKKATILNDIFNMLAKKGYRLITSGGDSGNMTYVFEK